MPRVTLTISQAAYEKAEREGAETNWTAREWMTWVIESYDPPVDIVPEPDEDEGQVV